MKSVIVFEWDLFRVEKKDVVQYFEGEIVPLLISFVILSASFGKWQLLMNEN